MRSFESLTERELLALAISLEEEDERVYADFAEGCATIFPVPHPCSTACARKNPAIAAASSHCFRSDSAITSLLSGART